MVEVQIVLAGLWVCLMLSYLLGDVMRIFSGDFKPGLMDGKPMTQKMLLGMAALMVIPIFMVFFSLTLSNPLNQWANIIAAIALFLFNAVSINTYPSAYDKFLLVVGLIFNALTIYYAWTWL